MSCLHYYYISQLLCSIHTTDATTETDNNKRNKTKQNTTQSRDSATNVLNMYLCATAITYKCTQPLSWALQSSHIFSLNGIVEYGYAEYVNKLLIISSHLLQPNYYGNF